MNVDIHFPGTNREVLEMKNIRPIMGETIIIIDEDGTEEEYTVSHVATVLHWPNKPSLYVVAK